MKNYYMNEINKLNTNSSYPWSIVIRDGEGGETNELNINKESIQVLRDILIRLEYIDDGYIIDIDKSGYYGVWVFEAGYKEYQPLERFISINQAAEYINTYLIKDSNK